MLSYIRFDYNFDLKDIDECARGYPCRRNQKCLNTNGSYKCQSLLTCSGGYTSNDDGTQCIGKDRLCVIFLYLVYKYLLKWLI